MKPGEREFTIISCNRFDCVNKNGSGCRKSTVRIDNHGNCLDYVKKDRKDGK